ncbi:MAG: HDOD domain-containing protein [Desulfobacteraceae bacterium]|jgi:HD-like signal output (HDOD) protein
MTPDKSKKGFDFDPIDISGLIPIKKADTPEIVENIPLDNPEELTDEESNIIDALYLKMKKKGDFPTFSRQIIEVNQIITTDKSSAKDISQVIMKDFSLTNKLIKLVNTAMYSQFNQNGVSSVASAMNIMGSNQIQRTASSLMLFEHMRNNSQNQNLKDTTMLTYMSGLMSKDLARLEGFRDQEEFQICGMFHKLGENLVAFYFPDKFRLIHEIEKNKGLSKNEAAKKILGVDFKTLGTGVAKKWRLPNNIVKSMAFDPSDKVSQGDSEKTITRAERLGRISSFSNALCDIYRNPSPEQRDLSIAELLKTFDGMIDLNLKDVEGLVKRASERLKAHASIMNISISQNEILANMDNKPVCDDAKSDNSESALQPDIKVPRENVDKDIKRIEGLLAGPYQLSDILIDILNVMHKGFDYNQIAICIKDVRSNDIMVRHGLGKGIDILRKEFRFTLSKSEDIFHFSLLREKDYTIHDINDPKFKALIPAWYRQLNIAKGFDLYSLVIDHVPLGFFYADRENVIDHSPFDQQKCMKKLRGLAEKAIRIKKNLA